MTDQPERKINRKAIALSSAILLFAAAAVGFYSSTGSFETLFDRSVLHQCNGPQRGLKATPGSTYNIAALAPNLARLYYIPVPAENRRDFCRCELLCNSGNADLYMTDYEGYWVFPEFLNDWRPEEEYDCVSTQRGNIKDVCQVRGVEDDWYCYIMVRGRTAAAGCTLDCEFV